MGEHNIHITAAPSVPLSKYRKQSWLREISKARNGKVMRYPPERVSIEVSAGCPDGEKKSYKCESEERRGGASRFHLPRNESVWGRRVKWEHKKKGALFPLTVIHLFKSPLKSPQWIWCSFRGRWRAKRVGGEGRKWGGGVERVHVPHSSGPMMDSRLGSFHWEIRFHLHTAERSVQFPCGDFNLAVKKLHPCSRWASVGCRC